MKMNKHLLLSATAIALAGAAAHAAVVVNFDGTDGTLLTTSVNWGVKANTALATTTIANDTIRSSVAYGATLATSGSGTYTGPTLIGGAYINAVYSTDQAASTLESTWGSVSNVSTRPDVIRIRRNGPTTNIVAAETTTRWAYTFNVTAGGPYGIDASSALTLRGAIGGHTADEGRWLLVNDGTLYVSQSTINYNDKAATYSLSNLHTENWAAWTPGTDLALGTLSFTVAGSSLTDIERAGFYGTKTGSTGQNVDISAFTANLAVPEPSTYAAILGLLAMGLVLRRRVRA